MSNDVPVQVVVAAFQDEQGAKAALKELKEAKKQKLIKIENAAVLRKDEKGKLHIKETADVGGGKGAVFGGVAGAAVGLLAGPALVVPAAVGALVGGLTAKAIDGGFKDDRLKKVGEGLQPGSSAIIAVVEHKWVDQVIKEMANAGADAFAEDVGADIAAQLEAGHEVAYSALATQEGLVAERQAGGEDEVEGGRIVVDDTGAYGARFVATKDGFAAEAIESTDEGVVAAAVVGTVEEGEEEEKSEKS